MTAATAPDLAPDAHAKTSVAASGELAVTLASIAPGGSARILGVDGTCPQAQRLRDLGFVPGTRVEVLKRAPLGDPVIYGLRGYRICLRATEAARVRVRPE